MDNSETKRGDQIAERAAEKFNPSTSKGLLDGENAGASSYSDGNSSPTADATDAVKDGESTSGWKNAWSGGSTKTKGMNAKVLLKKFGPSGLLGGGLIGIVISLSSSIGAGSLLINLKETITGNFDYAGITSDYRSPILLSKRLAEADTNSKLCTVVKAACRYTKPSTKLLKNLEGAGIKAIAKDGSIIEKQKLLGGTRPDSYQLADGKTIKAADFKNEIRTNAEFRDAFRRAHNPRWANWADDVAAKFFKSRGLTKKLPDSVSNAKNADSALDASKVAAKVEKKTANEVNDLIKEEVSKFAESSGKTIQKGGKGDAALTSAQIACVASKAPLVVSKVISDYRKLQGIKFAMLFLVVADKIKSGQAKPEEVSNLATSLTQTYTVNGATSLSAMSSGAMLYAMVGDVGSAQNSKTLKKYIPGYAGDGVLGNLIQISSNKNIKGVCNLLGSDAAAGAAIALSAFKAAKATNPVGWVMLAIDALTFAVSETGVLDDFVEYIIKETLGLITSAVDVNALLKGALGDYTEGALGEELGDITGTSLTNMFSDAGSDTIAPLSGAQKVAFDQNIATPTRLAWAEEDRLNYSPFDVSNPNTFLGSIATKLLPYWGTVSTTSGAFSTVFGFLPSAFGSMFSQGASASGGGVTSNLCTADPLLAMNSDVAIGPTCDVYRGIPAEYLGIDPLEVVSTLYGSKQIDSEGNVVADSDYEAWNAECHAGSDASASSCVIRNKTQAMYELYRLDTRILNQMDVETDWQVNTVISAADTSGAIQPASGKVVSPIEPGRTDIQMSAKYGYYRGSGAVHFGVDLASNDIFNVVSACDGTVKAVLVNPVYANTNAKGVSGSTNYVWIDCGNNVYMGYAHFFQRDLKPYVTVGAKIGAGTVLFPEGNQGNSSGYHLHFQVSTVGSTSYTAAATTDPAAYLSKLGIQLPKPSY